MADEQRALLLRAVDELRADRRVVTFRFFFDLSEAEVAAALGVTRGTVKLQVDGGRRVWFEGQPHLFIYRDRQGRIVDASVRRATSCSGSAAI